MKSNSGLVKFYSNKIEDREVEDVLSSFPELNNGANGLYNITALQIAAAFTKKGVTSTIRRLLMCEDVNRGDQLGRTPLHYAVMNGNGELVELLLNSGADPECKFLYLCTLRTSQGDYSKWNKLYTMLPPPDAWGRTPLHGAAKEGHVDIVKLLIKSKANVNAQDEKGVTPLLLAGGNKNKSAFEDIVEILVKSGAEVNVKNNITDSTALFHAVVFKSPKAVTTLLKAGAWLSEGPSGQSELHVAAAHSQSEILEMLLSDSRITSSDIRKSDSYERSPLCRAAQAASKECIKILIFHGASLSHTAKTKATVIDIIFARIARPLHFFTDIFDSRISGNDFEPTDEQYRVHLDFSILSPEGYDQQMDVISNILVAASEKEKVKILQHPLIESFLRLKWAKIRQFFFLLIFSYIIFVFSLSIYVVLLIHYPKQFEVIRNVTQYLVIVTAGGLSGHAIIQCTLVKRKFLHQHELLLYLTCTILSLVISLSGFWNTDEETMIDSTPKWILHASSIAVLLAWTELMLLIGRFPTYGYYALMFAVVLQNVIKVLFIFVCLLIGFALSFSIQFQSNDQFSNPWRALVKTTVMMMGEFDYEDLFDKTSVMRLSGTSRIIFLFFIILSSIVLMNLMVGLAVNDIQGVQQEGHARRLEKQAEFLRQLEQVISFKFIESKWFPAIIRRYLKQTRAIPLKLTLDPQHRNSMSRGGKKIKILSCDLIESIVKVARSQQEETGDLSKNLRLPDLIEALKVMIHRYEREPCVRTEAYADFR